MSIEENLKYINGKLGKSTKLIAISKTKPVSLLKECYDAGQRRFGENKVQEMVEKQSQLPPDTEWHLVGHLQTNKVKYIASFVGMIHSVDSLKLLIEINKQAEKHQRIISCLLQIYIASEETKFGLDETEVMALLNDASFSSLKNIRIAGVMGMATNTDDMNQVRNEFHQLKVLSEKLKNLYASEAHPFNEISMGMSSDYELAIAEGSTMVRVGSSIFGTR